MGTRLGMASVAGRVRLAGALRATGTGAPAKGGAHGGEACGGRVREERAVGEGRAPRVGLGGRRDVAAFASPSSSASSTGQTAAARVSSEGARPDKLLVVEMCRDRAYAETRD